MQIHFALSEPARWEGDERLDRTAIVHVTPGLDGVSRAVTARSVAGGSNRCRRPAADNGCVPRSGRQGDPRCRGGSRAMRRAQSTSAPERGRMSFASAMPTGSRALAAVRPNLESAVVRRVTLGPHDLERMNVNATATVRGCALARSELPLAPVRARAQGAATAVERLFHIGASTWPGPGLGAGSGTLVGPGAS